MSQITDIQERWNLNDSETELFKQAMSFLMQDEIAHLEKCEEDFEAILTEARTHRGDAEEVGRCFIKAGEAFQRAQAASEACDAKFQELLLVVSRPGNA